MLSSVTFKWLERLCLGIAPEMALLPHAPLWRFRPGLCASRLALAMQFLIHSLLAFDGAYSVDPEQPLHASGGEGDPPGVLLFVDVEKAFGKMQYPCQWGCLSSAGLQPSRAAAYMCELLHSEVCSDLR